MHIVVKAEPEFKILYDLPKDTSIVICIGGRAGKKTHEVSKWIAFQTMIKRLRTVLLRDEKALIKETILNEVWARYDTANKHGAFDAIYSKNEGELKEKATGNVLLYTKGFRASNNSKSANLKGASDISIAVLEEAEDFRDPLKYNTFVDSLRKEGCIIVILMNVPDIQHFLLKRYFNFEHVLDAKGEATGYFNVIPKDLPGFVCIKTNYKNNPYLPAHIVYNYEQYGNPNSPAYDFHYYMTSIMGYASTGRKGQVFTKVKPIKYADYMALNLQEIIGQDFGTASPAATTGVKLAGNKAYIRLINYKPMPVLELGKMYSRLKLGQQDKIVCDYAEPDTINKLANGWPDLDMETYRQYPELRRGFYAVPCPSKNIQGRINLMTGMELYAVEEHQELWEEINNFVYAVDKYGNYTDTPIDAYNHAFFDAAGYVIEDQRGKASMRVY